MTKKPRATTKGKPRRAATKTERTAPPVAEPAPAPAAEPVGAAVLVCEKSRTNATRAAECAAALGYEVVSAADATAALAILGAAGAPEIVLVDVPGGAEILAAVAALGTERPVVVASLGGPAATAGARAAAAGADLPTLRPHSKDSLVGPLSAALALAAERRKVAALQGTEELLRERLLRYGQADAVTGFRHFDFFKQILVMEIKRAKRYGYPLAACLIGVDAPPRELGGEGTRTLRTRIATAIAGCLRDIDWPVDVSEERFLVFLPYTDLDGAERVGARMAAAARACGIEVGGERLAATVSIGIAATRPGKPVSFARLMRDAGAALRAAQLKGGGRVVVRR